MSGMGARKAWWMVKDEEIKIPDPRFIPLSIITDSYPFKDANRWLWQYLKRYEPGLARILASQPPFLDELKVSFNGDIVLDGSSIDMDQLLQHLPWLQDFVQR